MGRSGAIPDRWLDYAPIGRQVEGTRFIAFKVPLRKSVCEKLNDREKLHLEKLINSVPNLGLIIDLTNTTKYYDPNFFSDNGIKYLKLASPGKEIPTTIVRDRFNRHVKRFLDANIKNDKLIGVHCTHGINRTGFLICSHMVTEMKMDANDAIARFEKARGHQMERLNYVNAIHVLNINSSNKNEAIELPRNTRFYNEDSNHSSKFQNSNYSYVSNESLEESYEKKVIKNKSDRRSFESMRSTFRAPNDYRKREENSYKTKFITNYGNRNTYTSKEFGHAGSYSRIGGRTDFNTVHKKNAFMKMNVTNDKFHSNPYKYQQFSEYKNTRMNRWKNYEEKDGRENGYRQEWKTKHQNREFGRNDFKESYNRDRERKEQRREEDWRRDNERSGQKKEEYCRGAFKRNYQNRDEYFESNFGRSGQKESRKKSYEKIEPEPEREKERNQSFEGKTRPIKESSEVYKKKKRIVEDDLYEDYEKRQWKIERNMRDKVEYDTKKYNTKQNYERTQTADDHYKWKNDNYDHGNYRQRQNVKEFKNPEQPFRKRATNPFSSDTDWKKYK